MELESKCRGFKSRNDNVFFNIIITVQISNSFVSTQFSNFITPYEGLQRLQRFDYFGC